ncbi:MAG: 23S rRNA (pseudouridine(1915)-N(3))-methyltransferase RlmH [Lachnospiraceae bacterium]|nr:23S rRNA (pseudouridine(1915)-N(3))-methyltransferase RlmH [Lachnospiraceae bacterium]
MHIKILTVGKIKENFYVKAIEEYSKRLSKYCRLEIAEVDDEPASGSESTRMEDIVKAAEGGRLLRHIGVDSYVIALAIEGKKMDSVKFSKKIEELGVTGKSDVTFVIGGSLGLDKEILKRADMLLSFSDMTFPHQLMRVILLEQIYRAFRIMRNEPYHK